MGRAPKGQINEPHHVEPHSQVFKVTPTNPKIEKLTMYTYRSYVGTWYFTIKRMHLGRYEVQPALAFEGCFRSGKLHRVGPNSSSGSFLCHDIFVSHSVNPSYH